MSNIKNITGLVLHFRTPEKTTKCLDSLLDAGLGRVVVVDNSEDKGASIEAMAPDLMRLREKGLKIDVISKERNIGFAAGVDFGINQIKNIHSSHVLLINSDAKIDEKSMCCMAEEIEDNDFVFPMCRNADSSDLFSLIQFYHSCFGLFVGKKKWGCFTFVGACCLLINKNCAKKNFLDQDFFFYGEDIMLGFSTYENKKYHECKSATVIHEGSGSSKNGSFFYEYHMARAHWLLAIKTAHNSFEKCIFIAFRIFFLALRATVRCFRFRALRPWQALIYATNDVVKGRYRTFTPKA